MVLGLFDPPQTKAQKRAAKFAQSLREQAVRDMVIELRMLINRQEQARQVQVQLFNANHDAATKIMTAVETAQETIDRVERFNDMFPRELSDLQRAATNAAGFEALASFELEGRDMMVKVRDEVKAQLVPLGFMAMEARELLNTREHETLHSVRTGGVESPLVRSLDLLRNAPLCLSVAT